MIEIGRYNQTTKDNRHCPFCGCNVIEDEIHFLFQCPTYSMIRNKFYYKVKTLIPNITQLPINILINELMNSSNYFINIHIFQLVLMFGTNYYQSNVIALCCNFDSKHSLCNTVCICMVMQIKLVVAVASCDTQPHSLRDRSLFSVGEGLLCLGGGSIFF